MCANVRGISSVIQEANFPLLLHSHSFASTDFAYSVNCRMFMLLEEIDCKYINNNVITEQAESLRYQVSRDAVLS